MRSKLLIFRLELTHDLVNTVKRCRGLSKARIANTYFVHHAEKCTGTAEQSLEVNLLDPVSTI